MFWCRSFVCPGRRVLTFVNRSLFVQCSPLCGSFHRRSENLWICRILSKLSPSDKMLLYQELSKSIKEKPDSSVSTQQVEVSHLTYAQLQCIFIGNCIPFIGFGFLDNAIMIVAGEYIDVQFATFLGISTMAAAGLGNLVSDLFGIGLVGYVEKFMEKIGISVPPLSASQLASSSVRWSIALGRIVGITTGCLLGLLPLVLFNW
ncbi:unnamed protein product [Schistosoma margrebowiei]|uniref:Transmembrane protein 65 n=1 Tax=Schistosoma margrebowiei TaxID=48269 RepID=A0AA84Z935_9TREM|nr:unnamed protein product [Schistosoma margrebowiei]